MTYKIQHIPLGNSLPVNNPHSVSVSLPTLEDVIGYEENRPEILNQLKNGYPRFFKNKMVPSFWILIFLKLLTSDSESAV